MPPAPGERQRGASHGVARPSTAELVNVVRSKTLMSHDNTAFLAAGPAEKRGVVQTSASPMQLAHSLMQRPGPITQRASWGPGFNAVMAATLQHNSCATDHLHKTPRPSPSTVLTFF